MQEYIVRVGILYYHHSNGVGSKFIKMARDWQDAKRFEDKEYAERIAVSLGGTVEYE